MSVCCFRNTNVPLSWFVLYQLILELCSEQVNVIYNVLIKLFLSKNKLFQIRSLIVFCLDPGETTVMAGLYHQLSDGGSSVFPEESGLLLFSSPRQIWRCVTAVCIKPAPGKAFTLFASNRFAAIQTSVRKLISLKLKLNFFFYWLFLMIKFQAPITDKGNTISFIIP